MKKAMLWIAIWAAAAGSPARAQTNGIFADFATSMGGFTCRLEYAKAPKATANFIGIATGSRAWMEEATGKVLTNAYFNGLTFHRVIRNFMIQGGSPNGQGTDGPGYVFPDEFDASLRFDGPGVLAMANSGPRSNGSQFFITVTNTSWLNDVHTIFGSVVDGQSVVDAISQVAVNTNSRPFTNVVIQSIAIRRVGPEAQAFDIDTQSLPVVGKSCLGIAISNTQATLTFTNQLYADNYLCESTNLSSWTSIPMGVYITEPVTNRIQRPADKPACFYSLSRVQYPSSTFAPRTLRNRTLVMAINGYGTNTISFNATGSGTYNYNGSPGTVTSYSWYQDIYVGYLWPIYYSGLSMMTLKLNFNSDTNGAFSGTVYSTTPFSISGSFTLPAP